ncbi:MAG: ACP S-malonyltransferase [candidate division Zixibacteria bacterium]|nr:ACP S-malonyltransferase [candidate division Zixibacteria bacterium]
MNRKVLFFPGQASQYVGMGKDLYESSEAVRRLYELASDEMRLDIARLSFEGPAEELKRTHVTQPAILLHSLAVLTVLDENIPEFDFAAGHSLGEYGALAACGALSFEDAVKAVIKRAALMEEACLKNEGTMAAIMGLSIEQIQNVCETASADGVVVPANFNSEIQIVISGTVAGVERAITLAKETGAKRAMKLEVGGAFHSPLMEPARLGLGEYLANVVINRPNKPVVANVTGQPVDRPEEIRELLVRQLTAPVKWAQTMDFLKEEKVTEVIEIGPGKVLTGLAKRALQPENMINLDKLEDVNNFVPIV